jgi:uncharacterized protein YqeY
MFEKPRYKLLFKKKNVKQRNEFFQSYKKNYRTDWNYRGLAEQIKTIHDQLTRTLKPGR